jgi:hypothetical protein
MPNPNNHLEPGYTYVKGYVRKQHTKTKSIDPLVIIMIMVVIACAIFPALLKILIALGIIIILLYILTHYKIWKLRYLNWRINKITREHNIECNLTNAEHKYNNLRKYK